jgi:tRNA A37 threonylcarbamoyladenosine dehydratase
MSNFLTRLELAVQEEGIDKLKNSTVAILGVGGVGSFSAEAIARSGVGTIILIDKDDIDITNVNRQIHALHSTVGKSKVSTMKERILDINPDCNVVELHMFYTDETYERLFEYNLDFLIDASDTITFKWHAIKECLKRDIKFISSMGAANKMDPTQFQIADLRKTKYDPIAKVLRQKCRKERIKGKIPVIYSEEIPMKMNYFFEGENRKQKIPPSSNAFTPSVAGLIAASYCVRSILGLV